MSHVKRVAKSKNAADVSGTHVWLVLMKAHRALQRLAIRSIEASEAGLSDFAVMEMLLHKGPQPVNEIGRRIELTSGAITTAVDRLEARGLVTREAHPSDRRARVVRLTARGEERAAKAFAAHKATMDLAATGLSKAERTTLIQLLKKLGTSAAERAAPPKVEE
jgi:MarR family transcriptional regulator, 2-MHQ and catechol-resistance regulon repressor